MEGKKFNPWLPYNERIRDFIRWYELGYYVILYTSCLIIFGWGGIIIALVLNWLNHLQGGPQLDTDIQKDRKIKCSANIEDCEYCGNGYDHEWNVSYKDNRKWYEKVL